MKRTIGVLGIALVLSCSGARVFAQTDAAAPAATPKASEAKVESAQTTYRMTYTLTEMDGSKRIGTQHFTLTVNPGKEGRVRLGSKVPIATDSSNPANQFRYTDVGLNIMVRLKESAAGVLADSDVEQSGVSEEESGVGKSAPVIRQATLSNTALLTLGKPVMLGSLDVPGSTRHLDIEVVVEVVR
jgi:hypothetical protein